MKKTILFCVIALVLGAGSVFATDAAPKTDKKAAAPKEDCADCPMHKKTGAKKCGGKMCPEQIPGVTTVSKNIASGIEVTMSAKNAETVAKLQELALVHYGNKETMDPACPGRVEGAESKLENTADGARVLITGKTPGVIKKIQEASAREHMKAAPAKEGKKSATAARKFVCPMGDYQGDKPGKCPKCGMQLAEKK
jgi:rubrerythrin